MSEPAERSLEVDDLILDLWNLEPHSALHILDTFQSGSENTIDGSHDELLERLRKLSEEDAAYVVRSITMDTDGMRHTGFVHPRS